MAKCEWCDIEFDPEEADYEFSERYHYLNYNNFKPCLCGNCAIQAIDDEVRGVYYETCESCKDEFDLFEHEKMIDKYYSEDSLDLTEMWDSLDGSVLCADCAIRAWSAMEDETHSDPIDSDLFPNGDKDEWEDYLEDGLEE